MRIVIATCTVDYSGRLSAHLDPAKRVIMLKGDGSVLIHSEGGSYKPLNWMTAPCTVSMGEPGEDEEGVEQVWTVQADKTDDKLIIRIHDVIADVTEDLGVDPGLIKDGASRPTCSACWRSRCRWSARTSRSCAASSPRPSAPST